MSHDPQIAPDPRTGILTAIHGCGATIEVRTACRTLNTRRARGLTEAASPAPSSGPVPPDVWTASFGSKLAEWEFPLIDLDDLGISIDRDGILGSDQLQELPPGAEASPFLDRKHSVVYKLFGLDTDGSIGKKLVLGEFDGEFDIRFAPANCLDIIEKIAVLNDGGGLPTEFLGLDSSANYLIAKQPLASPLQDYRADLAASERRMCGVRPIGATLRQHVFVTHSEGRCWLVGDLHQRNIMRDAHNRPVIIDALLCKISPGALKKYSWLRTACSKAEAFRSTGTLPNDDFADVIDDDL